jgi:aryl-alcohol dehydrogenase-like predicted oxidoreductase
MEYRLLGKSGQKVSAVGLGCNNFGMRIDQAMTDAVVAKAIDLGITLFDTADVYGNRGGSETMLGKALGSNRHKVLIATKFKAAMGDPLYPEGGANRGYILRACEASLKRLNTDYIDLYQIHNPDPLTPVEETMRALDDLVRAGKVRYIGHSNFSGWMTADAAWIAKTQSLSPFVSAQNRYSVMSRAIETDLVPACEKFGLSVLPFFPLESGLLTGKYKRGETPEEGTRFAAFSKMNPQGVQMLYGDHRFALLQKLEPLCERFSHSLLQLGMGWLMSRPIVASVIAGATSPEQLEQNVAAAAWRPAPEESEAIDAVTKPGAGGF